ncbi:MAG: FeoB-associated Cys-rich membrane protein [Oscillospiraceae bacterium]|nr:FeoB-associated Cys-rich membrane protein [Oscillospiraceae bacterium]
MFAWLSANLINIVLVAVIVLITGLLIRSMVRDKKAGKSSCGGNCASCGACSGCSACGTCGAAKPAAMNKRADTVR